MRICSFLPSGTEILFALGLGDSVCGVTFECDYPFEARSKPVVVFSKLPHGLTENEIDRQVKDFSAQGNSLYRLDADKLREIQPDVIVTQDLCHVCAASPNDLGAVLSSFVHPPNVLALSPRTIEEVWSDIQTVGDHCERPAAARQLVFGIRQRLGGLKPDQANVPRVLCLEWLDPPFVGGHWVPEMVGLAGGVDVLGRAGQPGYEIDGTQLFLLIPTSFWQCLVATTGTRSRRNLRRSHFRQLGIRCERFATGECSPWTRVVISRGPGPGSQTESSRWRNCLLALSESQGRVW
jgi:iron complex transport system substrate-binding protein